MRVLITAGPTREPLDDVRFLSNRSSGKTGYALAAEAAGRGHAVTLVSGPVCLKPPSGVEVVLIETADEMIESVLSRLGEGFDVLVSAAAIADYMPVKTGGKIPSGRELTVRLEPTRNLVKTVRGLYPGIFLVAFKAEYDVSGERLVEVARERITEDGLDLVVANDVSKKIFDSDETEAFIVGLESFVRVDRTSKTKAAGVVWDVIESSVSS